MAPSAPASISAREKKSLLRDSPVAVYVILGSGDAFGAGFLCGHLRGWGWYQAARLGNACGAIVVTRHGCAKSMPTFDQAIAFAIERGGLS
ncbi:MAG: hypothetical protein HY782_18200 [Chloroflexi bacterium]|nr:hypothetical protein [Chloroflexota bacterium]